MRTFFFILTLLFLQKTFADQPRTRYSFKSLNSRYELKPSDTLFSDNKIYTDSIYDSETKTYYKTSYSYPDRYYWGLYDTQTKQKLYTIKNDSLFIEFKTAVISNDGRNIVIVDDYSAGFGYKGFEIMTFYEKDKLIKHLKLGDLIQNMCALSYSVSHMTWCSRDFDFNDRNEIKIKTHEFYNYTFDKNGELLNKQSHELIQPNDILAIGKIKRKSRNKYLVEIKFCIRGILKANTILELKCKDSQMKKVYGHLYGFLRSKKKAMKKEFTRTILIRNSKIHNINFAIPIYNSYESCNDLNLIE
ncbi:hypothetical protein QQY79_05430 [Flavobacterium tructae]|uniref:hypothetical protein n=1 Tax=Flavobacterium tructae TaxID=1114873 RepID=UPI002551D3BB|nr:hypothetical protein [Flavobacterium tructae]MDL2141952.1 hypothetical protein [Flavobacterium tructae]